MAAFALGVLILGVAVILLRRTGWREPREDGGGAKPALLAASAGEIADEARRIGPLLTQVVQQVGDSLVPGMTTAEVNRMIVEGLHRHDLTPAMLGFNGFPAASTIAINEQVLHVPPSGRVIAAGDLVTIQTAARTDRAFANIGRSFAVGELDEEKARLLGVAGEALHRAIATMKAGTRTGDVGAAIQEYVEEAGFFVVRDYVGYAMGASMMEEPQLPCYGRRGSGPRLKPGAIFNVHVIISAGGFATTVADDEWSVSTMDGRPSVLMTAMVIVEEEGAEVVTPFRAQPER